MSQTSIFAYPLTRRYPAHFTWIIVVCGALLTALLTLFAVAGNAYQSEIIYTPDPNTTIASEKWFQRRPFTWASNLETTCQPALLSRDSDYETSAKLFQHTLDTFHREHSEGDIVFAASYLNFVLTDCKVSVIEINLERTDWSRQLKEVFTWLFSYAQSIVKCSAHTSSGPMKVNFTSRFPPVRKYDMLNNFKRLNDTSHPGRAIGAYIMYRWYSKLVAAMSFSVPLTDNMTDPDGPS